MNTAVNKSGERDGREVQDKMERLNREIRRHVRMVGSSPAGNSAPMLGCVRLRMWLVPSGAIRSTKHEAPGGSP